MELLSLKLIVLTLSGAIRLFFGLLPLALLKSFKLKPETSRHGWVKKMISLLMFFGGGVLIATCFLHLMPHVRSSFEEAKLDTSLPVPEIIFIGGFFMVYMLEDLVHGCVDGRRKRKQKKIPEGVRNYGYNVHHPLESSPAAPAPALTIIPRIRSNEKNLNPSPIYHVSSVPTVKVVSPNGKGASKSIDGGVVDPNFTYVDPDWWKDNVIANSQLNLLNSNSNSTFTVRSSSLYDIPLGTPCAGYGHGQGQGQGQGSSEVGARARGPIQPIEYDASSETSSGSEDAHGHGHGHSHSHHLPPVDEVDGVASALRNLLIVVAISFHGVFEGLAIGLQQKPEDVWVLFLAVSLHECTILFCIGVELISSKATVLKMLVYILIVSLVCPIGMAIGIVVSEAQGSIGNQLILIGSLQGLAAGTLLYVAFFEIFAAEGKALKRKYIHIIVAIVGFVFMGALELLGGHSHGGGGGHGHSHSHGTVAAISGNKTIDDHSDHAHDEHAPNGFHSHEESDHGHDHGHHH